MKCISLEPTLPLSPQSVFVYIPLHFHVNLFERSTPYCLSLNTRFEFTPANFQSTYRVIKNMVYSSFFRFALEMKVSPSVHNVCVQCTLERSKTEGGIMLTI